MEPPITRMNTDKRGGEIRFFPSVISASSVVHFFSFRSPWLIPSAVLVSPHSPGKISATFEVYGTVSKTGTSSRDCYSREGAKLLPLAGETG